MAWSKDASVVTGDESVSVECMSRGGAVNDGGKRWTIWKRRCVVVGGRLGTGRSTSAAWRRSVEKQLAGGRRKMLEVVLHRAI